MFLILIFDINFFLIKFKVRVRVHGSPPYRAPPPPLSLNGAEHVKTLAIHWHRRTRAIRIGTHGQFLYKQWSPASWKRCCELFSVLVFSVRKSCVVSGWSSFFIDFHCWEFYEKIVNLSQNKMHWIG